MVITQMLLYTFQTGFYNKNNCFTDFKEKVLFFLKFIFHTATVTLDMHQSAAIY